MHRSLLLLLAAATIACSGKDADGDGYPASEDCDDESDAINPGATELCDGVDNDCDGDVDEGVADTWYLDADDDGYGNPDATTDACAQPDGYVDNDEDCNDSDVAFQPGAPEFCEDPNDYNCDGSVGYEDADGDGVAACEDCDDTDAIISPDAPEICDGIDNDCDGDIDVDADPTVAFTWYFDGDQDGYGDPAYSINSCDPPFGYADNADDCDDTSELAFPGGVEVCDELDNDCDGTVDGADAEDAFEVFIDVDGDGYGLDGGATLACEVGSGLAEQGGDCADDAFDINPGQVEVCNDGLDNDCDGSQTGCAIDAADAGLALSGVSPQDYAGISMMGRADVNNDGFPDLFVGANQVTTAASREGAAYVLYGPVSTGSMSLGDADAVLQGPDAASETGITMGEVGDLNGDGLDDVVIASRRANSNGTASGSVFLLLGSNTTWSGALDLENTADHQWAGDRAYNWMGAGVAGPGDVDGDGFDDLVAGSHGADSNGTDSGTIWLLLGSDDTANLADDVGDADASWNGERASDFAGSVLAGLGDMDGDGLADFAVGVNRGDAQGAFTGVVYVISSADASGSNNLADATALINGDTAGDRLGQAIAAAGDMDGDGLADLWAGASREDTNGADSGAAYLVSGVSDLTTLNGLGVSSVSSASFYGAETSDGLGAAIGGGEDFDGDGTNDLVLGVAFAGLNEEGAAYLFLSPSSGTFYAGTDEDAVVVGDGSGDTIGRYVGLGGDLFGSGSNTLMVGSWQDDAAGTDSGGAYVFDQLGL